MATHPVMMTNGLPNPALMGNGHFQQQQTLPIQKPSTMHHHQPQVHPQAAPWSGGSAGSSGPPSFSSHPPPLTSLGSPNDVGLMSSSSAGPQQPPKPVLSPGPPPPPPAPPAPQNNADFQSSYSGTELVMLYDYKVHLDLKFAFATNYELIEPSCGQKTFPKAFTSIRDLNTHNSG